MGFPQPITIAEIKAYAEVNGFAKSELKDLMHYVRELDSIYLQESLKKREREAKSKKHG